MVKMNFWEILKRIISALWRWIDDRMHNRTDLMVAVRDLNKKEVERLLHNRDVNKLDKDNNTALMYVVDKNFKENEIVKEIIDMLVLASVNLNNVNKNGKTALIHACENNDFCMAEYLIMKGAEVDIENEQGMRAIHYVNDRNIELRRLLIEHSGKALYNIPDEWANASVSNFSLKTRFKENMKDEQFLNEMEKSKEVWTQEGKDISINDSRVLESDIIGSTKVWNEKEDEGYYSDRGVLGDVSKIDKNLEGKNY